MNFAAQIGSQLVELPVVPISDELAISLLMTIDHGVRFLTTAAAEMAEQLRDKDIEVVVAPATLGIPVAIELTKALGLDDFVILQKTRKIHLADALSSATRSITTAEDQALLLDRARLGAVKGRRVALVDDVISTGSSIVASLDLLRTAEADVVAIGALLAEGTGWRQKLGTAADLVFTLGTIPVFDATPEGWTPRW